MILSLLRKAIGLQPEPVTGEMDEKLIARIVLHSGVLLTVYPYLPDGLKTQLKNSYLSAVKQSVQQEYEGGLTLKALSDAGMHCIALKGWELRKLYPEPTMRQMADLDILVKPYDHRSIKAVMERLGYTCGEESSWKHDSFQNGVVHVEMHKRLTDDSDAIRGWENGMWDRATTTEDNICKMSPEDYYIFHFVHLHKDFLNGSLGLRRIVDTWLLQKRRIDMETVRLQLESFGMWAFHERMIKLCKAAMGDESIDDNDEILLQHAFTHGIYGSGKSYKVGRIVSMSKDGSLKKGKRRSATAAVFLPYKRMKAQFPILQKWPILLPLCWLVRIVRFLKGDMKRSRRMLDYRDVSEADCAEMERFFKAGGIL